MTDLLASNYLAGFAELRGSGCSEPAAYTLGFPQVVTDLPDPIPADVNGDGIDDVVTPGVSAAWVQAGMLLPCARPHEVEEQFPFTSCKIETDGETQTLSCR